MVLTSSVGIDARRKRTVVWAVALLTAGMVFDGYDCKWWAPKTAYDVINTCLLLHGQYGYRTEKPIEQRLRDVLGLQIGDGTAQIMKLIISRQKLGRALAP